VFFVFAVFLIGLLIEFVSQGRDNEFLKDVLFQFDILQHVIRYLVGFVLFVELPVPQLFEHNVRRVKLQLVFPSMAAQIKHIHEEVRVFLPWVRPEVLWLVVDEGHFHFRGQLLFYKLHRWLNRVLILLLSV